jgi:cation diffusion facilitator CzcD-associated flavoprotein CzcO
MSASTDPQHYDAIVVGAGFGGLCCVHFLEKRGFSTLGIEGASGVGGVWHHNRYPGARVDVESIDYCFYFDPDLYREWRWSERYATQPELLRYLDHVADRFDIRRRFVFGERVTSATWRPTEARWAVTTSAGRQATGRFLIMATGQLSEARIPPFPGIDQYQGEWVQTSHWPERPVEIENRRVAVIGTGSSGIQTIGEVAKVARQLFVFQRSPNFSVPAWNGPIDDSAWEKAKTDVPGERRRLIYGHPGATHIKMATGPGGAFTPERQQALLEAAWREGGHGMATVFTDQGSNPAVNEIVSEFVRNKIRSIVADPIVAEKLCPFDHPIGTRRLVVDTGYFETYNRKNVTLVDVKESPIERITRSGIRLEDGREFEVDLIIFALGFHAFTGSLDRANVRNERGEAPSDRWKRGPRTLLGLMTVGFPNLFLPTGPGSPSVLANLSLQNEYHAEWIANCIGWLDRNGHRTIEPSDEGEARWTAHVAEVAETSLRRQVVNYMTHFNDDGTKVFIPYIGGMDRYAKQADEIAAKGYEGFRFTR